MKINSMYLFDAIYGAADAAGYLNDLKPIQEYASNSRYAAFTIPSTDDLIVECVLNLNGSEGTWIDFYACYENERRYFGCVKTLQRGPGACSILGAAAGLMQHTAEWVVWQIEHADKQGQSLTVSEVVERMKARA